MPGVVGLPDSCGPWQPQILQMSMERHSDTPHPPASLLFLDYYFRRYTLHFIRFNNGQRTPGFPRTGRAGRAVVAGWSQPPFCLMRVADWFPVDASCVYRSPAGGRPPAHTLRPKLSRSAAPSPSPTPRMFWARSSGTSSRSVTRKVPHRTPTARKYFGNVQLHLDAY